MSAPSIVSPRVDGARRCNLITSKTGGKSPKPQNRKQDRRRLVSSPIRILVDYDAIRESSEWPLVTVITSHASSRELRKYRNVERTFFVSPAFPVGVLPSVCFSVQSSPFSPPRSSALGPAKEPRYRQAATHGGGVHPRQRQGQEPGPRHAQAPPHLRRRVGQRRHLQGAPGHWLVVSGCMRDRYVTVLRLSP